MPKFASIDIGTNTLRLLIAEAGPKRTLRPLVYKRVITRLGAGFAETGRIGPDPMERTLRALEGFSALIETEGVERTFAVATSVVRSAANGGALLAAISERTGLEVRVISGEEEARLTVTGVLAVIGRPPKVLVMDIGGGSTEFVAVAGGDISGAWSMDLGVVHLSENFLSSDPPLKAELNAMEAEIDRNIEELKALMAGDGADPLEFSGPKGAVFAGTAGTVTTLAAIDMGLEEYDPARVNNYILPIERIERMYRRFLSMKAAGRESLPGMEKGRGDLIVPGAAISIHTMRAFDFREMRVSDAGLLEGVILANLGLEAVDYDRYRCAG